MTTLTVNIDDHVTERKVRVLLDNYYPRHWSGIRRIREVFEKYGLKTPKFENFQDGFRVVVYADKFVVTEKKLGERHMDAKFA